VSKQHRLQVSNLQHEFGAGFGHLNLDTNVSLWLCVV